MPRNYGKVGNGRWEHNDRMVSVSIVSSPPFVGPEGEWGVLIAEHETHEGRIGRPAGAGSVEIPDEPDEERPRHFDNFEDARQFALQWMREHPFPVDKNDPESITYRGERTNVFDTYRG